MSTTWSQPAKAVAAEEPALGKRLETAGWALLLISTGIVWMAPKGLVPDGAWLIAFGLILVGVNAARRLNGLAVSGLGVALGVLALGLGGAELAGWILGRALDLPVLALWLVALGVVILAREIKSNLAR